MKLYVFADWRLVFFSRFFFVVSFLFIDCVTIIKVGFNCSGFTCYESIEIDISSLTRERKKRTNEWMDTYWIHVWIFNFALCHRLSHIYVHVFSMCIQLMSPSELFVQKRREMENTHRNCNKTTIKFCYLVAAYCYCWSLVANIDL